ncbi:hypothetical protein L873DRAFT_1841066 [Choiromyces venosus 120613-1]|uniref:Uncharacterized protein n=1 Tax=Choiromyces venosus 120613-1 TaxID=1336337 RepID=A0A3N4JZV9_9PEZI|nr:hypothetical protein L873DRAFT_1841066 [Choiromyces venosus 120613-1]
MGYPTVKVRGNLLLPNPTPRMIQQPRKTIDRVAKMSLFIRKLYMQKIFPVPVYWWWEIDSLKTGMNRKFIEGGKIPVMQSQLGVVIAVIFAFCGFTGVVAVQVVDVFVRIQNAVVMKEMNNAKNSEQDGVCALVSESEQDGRI